MYRYQHRIFEKEAIYIAGPECFYTYGYDMLAAMRARAQSLGFGVTLPNDHPLDMENPRKTKRADSIFKDLEKDMEETTVIIADLEAYRGPEPDSGTVYELGMAYARGARCYGYTRDKRSLWTKNQKAVLHGTTVLDERGEVLAYGQLPFAPSVMGSTKIVEGDFDDCLKMLMIDLEEAQKQKGMRIIEAPVCPPTAVKEKTKPLIYLASLERYKAHGAEQLAAMKEICRQFGYEAVSPLDMAPGVDKITTDDPYIWAANVFDNCQQHVRDCDIIIADLNDFRGYEISNDVGFECGMGFELGKALYGYMDHTDKLVDKIPHMGEAMEYRDQTGSNVEDFDYPANLMFACSMTIFQGDFRSVIENIIRDHENK